MKGEINKYTLELDDIYYIIHLMEKSEDNRYKAFAWYKQTKTLKRKHSTALKREELLLSSTAGGKKYRKTKKTHKKILKKSSYRKNGKKKSK
jgi:hypothetical protein